MAYKDEDQGTTLVIIAWVFLAASTTIVALRFWVRLTRVHRIAVDDWLILTSLCSDYLHTIFVTIAYTFGLGRHITVLSDHARHYAVKWIFVCQFCAVSTTMFGRISFSSFLLQIIGSTKRWQKAFLWGVILTQLFITIPTIIQIYTQCGTHITALWDSSVAAHVNCQSPNVQTLVGFVQSSLNTVCDLILTILPCFILWHLHMPMATKIGLGTVLTLSIFAFGASIVKAVEIQNLASKSDITWAFVNLTIWVCVENNVVIMAASIPTLRPIMRRGSGSTGHGSGGQALVNAPYNKDYNSAGESSHHSSKSTKREPDTTWFSKGLGIRTENSVRTISALATTVDNNSEDHSLVPLRDQHITKTTDMHVEFEDHRDRDPEMNLESQNHGSLEIPQFHH